MNLDTEECGTMISNSEIVEKAKSQKIISLAVQLWSNAHNKPAPPASISQGPFQFQVYHAQHGIRPDDTEVVAKSSGYGEYIEEEKEDDEDKECNSTDEEELIREFALSTSWLHAKADDAVF